MVVQLFDGIITWATTTTCKILQIKQVVSSLCCVEMVTLFNDEAPNIGVRYMACGGEQLTMYKNSFVESSQVDVSSNSRWSAIWPPPIKEVVSLPHDHLLKIII